METENLDIKLILQDKGYPVRDAGHEIQSVCLWRGGKNYNLSINKKTGRWFDFVEARGGSFEKLLELIGGSIDETSYSFSSLDFIEELKSPKKLDKSILDSLVKDHSYWLCRAVDISIFNENDGFTAGIFGEGKMANRHSTIIYSQNKEIAGVSGRALDNWMKPKWKHLFKVSEVCFPLYLNRNLIIEKGEVILVESIGNLYSLWSIGIKNVICTFGTRLSKKILTELISLNPKKIIIALDNDSENNNVGNEAAEKMKVKLANFFDENITRIVFPPDNLNDWNETLVYLKNNKKSVNKLYECFH